MGTLFSTDALHTDGVYEPGNDTRQVEVLRPSGEEYLLLRIGELNEEHMGRGHAVQLDEAGAREVVEGLLRGMFYLGFSTKGLEHLLRGPKG